MTRQGFELTSEKKKEILRARAKLLAREIQSPDTEEECLEVAEFLLAEERYAIEAAFVCEVYPLKELTPLPGTPPFISGITNVRGQILSVMDIKKFFDLPEKGITNLNKIIVVRSDEMELCILADVMLGVRTIPLTEIQPSLPTLTGIREEFLRGITNERIIILDIKKILADERIIVHDDVSA